MTCYSCLVRSASPSGECRYPLQHPLLDRYLEFVASRSRPATLRAAAFDLKAFFAVVDKEPVEVLAADVFEFLAQQRGDRRVVRLSDRESGLSPRTIARGDTPVTANPVPQGLSTRRQSRTSRSRRCRWCGCARCPRSWRRVRSTGS